MVDPVACHGRFRRWKKAGEYVIIRQIKPCEGQSNSNSITSPASWLADRVRSDCGVACCFCAAPETDSETDSVPPSLADLATRRGLPCRTASTSCSRTPTRCSASSSCEEGTAWVSANNDKKFIAKNRISKSVPTARLAFQLLVRGGRASRSACGNVRHHKCRHGVLTKNKKVLLSGS